MSEVVRALLEEYVKGRDIASYIDDLWRRIGEKLKSRRRNSRNIQTIVRQVRAGK